MSLPATFYVPLERDILRLTGRDRQSFLQGMVSNDVASLTPGEGCYAFHLTSKGQIIADLLVLCLDDSLLLSTEPGWGVALTESLEHHLVMERVKISSSTATTYFVYGTKPDEPCVFNGLGWLVYDAPPAGLTSQEETTYEGLRIETGIPRGRIDFDEKTLAPETGQASRAIHYKKGCYVGQEVVARIDARGHTNRALVRLTLTELVAPKTPMFVDDKEVGWVTSCAIGPILGVPVALGYLRNEFAAVGTPLQVGSGSGVVR
ncbi:glycine cleavage T C-terminal barrel domain-containing protein [Armatimonas sp.]|uniref:CAF17-like 4Fe-4S cluster assembly/insertion protein YgfZ n=1 Tax=Armatimonas sp. TaxID=1872638 RepID=UPI00286CFBD4|nr:glycine cleavage T C-terminal barrel domain-containing protein [Armatimonas sp.]